MINVGWDIGIHPERENHARVAGMAAGPTRFLFGSSWCGPRRARTGYEWSGKQKWRDSSASRVQADGAKMGIQGSSQGSSSVSSTLLRNTEQVLRNGSRGKQLLCLGPSL